MYFRILFLIFFIILKRNNHQLQFLAGEIEAERLSNFLTITQVIRIVRIQAQV